MSWYVGGRTKHRTLHRERCGYKRQPYPWAEDATEEELVATIRRAGPMAVWAFHGCKFCCPALRAGLDQARTEVANPFVDDEEAAG